MEINDYKPLFDELRNESDRACAVLSRGILETHLQMLLESFLISETTNKEKQELFSGNGPLATFSSRIRVSYSLGLIRKLERDALNSVKSISNQFAHDIKKGLTFEESTIKQKIESTEMFNYFWNLPGEKNDKMKVLYDSSRGKFEYLMAFLTGGLMQRVSKTQNLPSAEMVTPPIY